MYSVELSEHFLEKDNYIPIGIQLAYRGHFYGPY